MPEPHCLHYDDFLWRIAQIAREHGVWSDASAVSLSALVLDPLHDHRSNRLQLAVFVYRFAAIEQGSSNPTIFFPQAIVKILPDGELSACESLPGRHDTQQSAGKRFTGAAADMTVEERSAFLEVYYELLVDEDGPLTNPWMSLNPEKRQDLHELFWAMVETPFIPFYKRYAADFIELIGTVSPAQPYQ